jgi:hypothetical protein
MKDIVQGLLPAHALYRDFFLSKLKPGNWSDSVVLKPYLSKEG